MIQENKTLGYHLEQWSSENEIWLWLRRKSLVREGVGGISSRSQSPQEAGLGLQDTQWSTMAECVTAGL